MAKKLQAKAAPRSAPLMAQSYNLRQQQPSQADIDAWNAAASGGGSAGGGGGGGGVVLGDYSGFLAPQGGSLDFSAFMPRYDLASDPAYQAYLATVNNTQDIYRGTAERERGMAQSERDVTVPRILESGVEARRGIDNSFEARGSFRSGERLRRLGLQQRDEQHRVGDVDRRLADRLAAIQIRLDQQLAELEQQKVTRGLEAVARGGFV